jgi:hypothetical protein
MALAHRRPYGIYRWLANAPCWFYRLGLGWLLGYRMVQITHREARFKKSQSCLTMFVDDERKGVKFI